MRHDGFHQSFTESLPTMFFQNKYIGKIGKGGVVADDSRKAYLCAVFVDPETETVFDGTFDNVNRNAFAPVGISQKAVNDIDLQQGFVGADNVVVRWLFKLHNSIRGTQTKRLFGS